MTLSRTFRGAARAITGSFLKFRSGKSRILFDCGLFQGSRSLEALNHRPLAFDLKDRCGSSYPCPYRSERIATPARGRGVWRADLVCPRDVRSARILVGRFRLDPRIWSRVAQSAA